MDWIPPISDNTIRSQTFGLLNFIPETFDGWLKEAKRKQRTSHTQTDGGVCFRIGGRGVPWWMWMWMWMRHH